FSDRKGRRKPLLFLVVGSFLFPFLLIYFHSPTALLIIGILYSVVNAAFWTIIVAYLYDTNPKEKGGQVYARALTALFIINLVAPFLSGEVIEHLGYQWLFSLSCYIAIIPMILLFFLKKSGTHHDKTLSVKGEVSDILNKPRFIKVWTVMLLVSFTSAFLTTFFPIFLKEEVGLSYAMVGLFFSASTIVLIASQPMLGWLADRFRSKVIIPANMVLMTAGLFLLSLVTNVWLIFLSKAVVPLGIFGARVKGASNVAKMTPNEEHALAQAMFKSSSGIGWAAMSMASPVLIAGIGYSGVFRLLGVISLLAGTWYWFAYKKKEKPKHEGFLHHFKHHHVYTMTDTNLLENYRHK
ncbi:MFS transporter, partial [Candidatus Woesearchaeota archaeon]|nr:MFS transporter [Candidatus Woesearchaeota archaeon]